MCGKHLLLQQKNVKPDGAAIPYSGFYFSFLKMHKYAMVTLVRKLRQQKQILLCRNKCNTEFETNMSQNGFLPAAGISTKCT